MWPNRCTRDLVYDITNRLTFLLTLPTWKVCMTINNNDSVVGLFAVDSLLWWENVSTKRPESNMRVRSFTFTSTFRKCLCVIYVTCSKNRNGTSQRKIPIIVFKWVKRDWLKRKERLKMNPKINEVFQEKVSGNEIFLFSVEINLVCVHQHAQIHVDCRRELKIKFIDSGT